MHTAVTVIKSKDHTVPDDFLAKVLEHHGKAVGIALQGEKCLDILRVNESQTVEGIKQAFSDNPDLLHENLFMSFQSGMTHEEDINPFTVVENSDGEPILVAFLDGDFSEYTQAESSHSPESFAVKDIQTLFKKLYSAANGDIPQLMEELREDDFTQRALVNMMVGSEGTITLVPYTGDVLQLSIKGDTSAKEFPWGWVSNTWVGGYGKPAEKPQSVLSKMGGRLQGGRLAAAKAAQTAAPPVETKPAVVAPDPAGPGPAKHDAPADPPKQDVPLNGGDPEEVLTVHVPTQFKNNGKRRKWFESHVPKGTPMPKDWLHAKTLSCSRKLATKQFLETYVSQEGLKGIADALALKTKPTETAIPQNVAAEKKEEPKVERKSVLSKLSKPASQQVHVEKKAEPELKKDTSTHDVSQPSKGIIAEPIAIIPPGQKAKILDIINSVGFKNAVDRNSQLMADPAKFQELEDKIPNIADQLGLKDLEDMLNWPYSSILKMVEEAPAFGAIALVNWRSSAMEWKKFADQLLAEQDKNKKQEPEPVQQKATGTHCGGVSSRLSKLSGRRAAM